jgi:hypothetical protein
VQIHEFLIFLSKKAAAMDISVAQYLLMNPQPIGLIGHRNTVLGLLKGIGQAFQTLVSLQLFRTY